MTKLMRKVVQISSIHKHDILVYTIYAVILALLLFVGSAHIHADSLVFPKQQINYLRCYQPKQKNQQRIHHNSVIKSTNSNAKLVYANKRFAHPYSTKRVNGHINYVRNKHINYKPIRRTAKPHKNLRIGSHHSYKFNHHSNYHVNNNWFRDGLSHRNFKARSWVAWHESNDRWNIVSYGHVCIGYFQLNPNYLGYKHGHVNLNHKHQVKVADQYASNRYGNWINAKAFWLVHHWY